MSQAYCHTCKEIVPLNCHIKKAVCTCGAKDLIGAYSRWSEKIGWDYFDSKGRFLKFVAHVPYGETVPQEKTEPEKQSAITQLPLFT